MRRCALSHVQIMFVTTGFVEVVLVASVCLRSALAPSKRCLDACGPVVLAASILRQAKSRFSAAGASGSDCAELRVYNCLSDGEFPTSYRSGTFVVIAVHATSRGDEGRVASLLQYLGRILTLRWWTPYQLVLVDHGRCIELTRKTRLEYCALWCYIVKGDKQKAAKIAREMCNGEVGAQLLPRVLYRRMTREERKKLKEELGFSDLIELLRGSPEALLDSLRVAGVVRHVASLLADIQFDRVYLECCQALWGLETSGVLEDELSDLHALMGENYWGFELGIRIRLLVMRMMMYVRSVRYSLSLVSDPPPVL
eukprot:evm.model.scf_1727.1 EVM.evm.TU.scf_1727.1   scf_1727:963-3621(+)